MEIRCGVFDLCDLKKKLCTFLVDGNMWRIEQLALFNMRRYLDYVRKISNLSFIVWGKRP